MKERRRKNEIQAKYDTRGKGTVFFRVFNCVQCCMQGLIEQEARKGTYQAIQSTDCKVNWGTEQVSS